MAHFRRRRPRASAHAKMYSQTGWRARHNLKPIKVPDWPGRLTIRGVYSLEYLRWREWRNRMCYPDSAPSQMANWPRWFDVVFHTRPQRRRTKKLEIRVRKGQVDPDNLCWPLSKRPLVYY